MIYLDTNILIYLLEGGSGAKKIADILTEKAEPVTSSVLAITEFLAGSDFEEAKEMLYSTPTLSFIDSNMDVAETAADLQKKHGLKIGDAIHLASAIKAKVSSFFTNDVKLARTARQYFEVIDLS